MRAGLITFHYAHHYGAQLQAYALRKTIESLGLDCDIIDYVRPDNVEGSRLFKKGLSAGAVLSNAHTLLHYPSFKRRHDRFEAFVRHNMKLGKKRYATFEALKNDPPAYDYYVCGSDQIWNPLIFKPSGFDPAFFAAFSETGKKVAYAPSLGIDSIPEPYKDELKSHLGTFAALSAREARGAEIISEYSGRLVPVVLDPTMLLKESDWISACAPSKPRKPYILCYFVSDPGPFAADIQSVSQVQGLPVVSLCGSRKRIPGSGSRIFDAGPGEFLSLIRDAAFVCTNSFHGAVFSVLFGRDFYAFESSRKSREESVNSRLRTLMKTLDLEGRLKAGNGAGLSEEEIKSHIDYKKVFEKLGTERKKSLDYLRNALQDK